MEQQAGGRIEGRLPRLLTGAWGLWKVHMVILHRLDNSLLSRIQLGEPTGRAPSCGRRTPGRRSLPPAVSGGPEYIIKSAHGEAESKQPPWHYCPCLPPLLPLPPTSSGASSGTSGTAPSTSVSSCSKNTFARLVCPPTMTPLPACAAHTWECER